MITAREIDAAVPSCAGEWRLAPGTIVTPLALERATLLGVRLTDSDHLVLTPGLVPADRPKPASSAAPGWPGLGGMSFLGVPRGVSPELGEITWRLAQRLLERGDRP